MILLINRWITAIRQWLFSLTNSSNLYAGPHTCIANHLATLEATVIAAIMAQKFRFDLPKTLKVRLEPCVSLRPRGGIKMYPKPL